jgi:ATP-binding cassette subfamily B multidrug efflux pump
MAVFAAIIDLIQRSIAPIKDIAGKVSSIQRARSGVIRLFDFNNDLSLLPKVDITKSYDKRDLEELEVNIPHFSYPQRKDDEKTFTLEDVYFKAQKGELLGIVGKSGCGKSTLLKILSTNILAENIEITFKTPSSESLVFRGEQGDLAEYKNQVSIVAQDSHVFTAPLFFNISLCDSVSTKLESFWQQVQSEIPYIEKWGVNLNTHIHPKDLSLGQKQLLSALRACFLQKPIVLFDEISSGLDSEVEEALRKMVLLIQKHSLTIIVAHRIETITRANQIFVMDAGRIVDRGTHDQLLSSSKTYNDFIAELKQLV